MTLKLVFDELKNNNIFINVDNSYFHTPNEKIKYKKREYIGYIQVINNKDYIIECLNEEGSADITYKFLSLGRALNRKNINLILLKDTFRKFGYEPYFNEQDKQIDIELVITKQDLTDEYITESKIFDVKVEDDVEKEVEDDIEKEVEDEDDIEKEVEDEVEKEVEDEDEVEKEDEDDVEKEVEDEDEVEKEVEDEVEKEDEDEDEVEKEVEDTENDADNEYEVSDKDVNQTDEEDG